MEQQQFSNGVECQGDDGFGVLILCWLSCCCWCGWHYCCWHAFSGKHSSTLPLLPGPPPTCAALFDSLSLDVRWPLNSVSLRVCSTCTPLQHTNNYSGGTPKSCYCLQNTAKHSSKHIPPFSAVAFGVLPMKQKEPTSFLQAWSVLSPPGNRVVVGSVGCAGTSPRMFCVKQELGEVM